MEVESTIRPAKDRIAGFEGREGHRTPFASAMGRHMITKPEMEGATALKYAKSEKRPRAAPVVVAADRRGQCASLAESDDSTHGGQQLRRIVADAILEDDFHLLNVFNARGWVAVKYHKVRDLANRQRTD